MGISVRRIPFYRKILFGTTKIVIKIVTKFFEKICKKCLLFALQACIIAFAVA